MVTNIDFPLNFTYSISYILQYGIRDLQRGLQTVPHVHKQMQGYYERAEFTCEKMDDILKAYNAGKS